jgi:hypothetical protein
LWYVANRYERRVELYIDRGDQRVNKNLFEQLHNRKEEIQRVFGEPLTWLELPEKKACRIYHTLPGAEFRDEEMAWPRMHNAMIEAMIRFERAFGPVIPTLKV